MLSTFPFLSGEEFASACRVLVDRGHCISAQSPGGWSSLRLVTQNGTSLRITRCIPIQNDAVDTTDSMEDALDEDDPEALVPDRPPKLQIDYDIVLSPTYRVPVLYFALRWHNHQGPLGLDAVYRYVVPAQYRKGLQSVGVMGGISFGYHPESGAPAFFVHPCNTADAMAQIAARCVSPGTYLLIWLGLVGHCVNLHVPRELVTAGSSPV